MTINPVSVTDPDPTQGGGDALPKLEGDDALPRSVRTWRRAYALVLGVLAADIALLWLLGQVYG